MVRLVVAAALLVPIVAHADPFEVSLKNQVSPGQKPTLTVRALEPLSSVTLDLRSDVGLVASGSKGPLKKGQTAVFSIGNGRAGRAHWKGKLAVGLVDGSQNESTVTFETVIVGEVRIIYRREGLDLQAHRFRFELNRPAGNAQLHVFAPDGRELGRGSAIFHGEAAGRPLQIKWTQTEGEVLRIELRAEDTSGAATLLRLFPWSVTVPHDEVVFATGSAVIAPSEEKKLDESYGRILAVVEKARKMEPTMPLKVFIAGHTDTVGTNEDNRRLSLERARAIAVFFRSRGLPLPLAYAGFGEEALKVNTADNTEEAKNRRVDYIVGAEEPVPQGGVRELWRELK